jgi:hypothetical protein
MSALNRSPAAVIRYAARPASAAKIRESDVRLVTARVSTQPGDATSWRALVASAALPHAASRSLASLFEQALAEGVPHELGATRQAELLHDVGAVRLCSADGDVQLLGDLLVRVAQREEAQYFTLAV